MTPLAAVLRSRLPDVILRPVMMVVRCGMNEGYQDDGFTAPATSYGRAEWRPPD
jgi:hypothetical protein